MSLLSDRKADLEKRLRIVTEERDTSNASLEEANDRIMVRSSGIITQHGACFCVTRMKISVYRLNCRFIAMTCQLSMTEMYFYEHATNFTSRFIKRVIYDYNLVDFKY